jgi:hypothetical protein
METILPWDQCNLVGIWIRKPEKFESRHFVLQTIIYDFCKFSNLLKGSNKLYKKNTRGLDLADLGRVVLGRPSLAYPKHWQKKTNGAVIFVLQEIHHMHYGCLATYVRSETTGATRTRWRQGSDLGQCRQAERTCRWLATDGVHTVVGDSELRHRRLRWGFSSAPWKEEVKG